MSDMEKTLDLEINPYDHLVEGYRQDMRHTKMAATDFREKRKEYQAKETVLPKAAETEVIPVSEKAVFSELVTKEAAGLHKLIFEIEEDLLVPDTEPDMDIILNADCTVDTVSFHREENTHIVRGEAGLEILYKSADIYNDRLFIIKNKIPFKKEWKENFEDESSVNIFGSVRKTEYRIVNERKYRLKVTVEINAKEITEKRRKIFENINGEKLELLKEKTQIQSISAEKIRETDISETLLIGNDKIKPLDIIKCSFVMAENHRQLTGEKLLLNSSIWVRILYNGEKISAGEFSNQPMLYTGKIDCTVFVPTGKECVSCDVNNDISELKAEINDDGSGFIIKGIVKTEASLYEMIEKETVADFYNLNDDMACDNKEETVCCGSERKNAEYTIRETIALTDTAASADRIIYIDAVVESFDDQESSGKIMVEVIAVTDTGQPFIARKLCPFTISRELPGEDSRYVADQKVFVREAAADISGANQINVTVQIQCETDICTEGKIRMITSPCIIREDKGMKSFPVYLYTVKEGETLWDIGKRYRVPADNIGKVNGVDSVSEGMKIVVAK